MIGDLKHAWRTIARMPVLASVVVVSLGIGIGVNTAVFSWVQAMVLRPLPGVAHGTSFQTVEARAETGSYPGVSWLEYDDLRARLRSFPDLMAFRMVPFNVGEVGHTQRTYGQLVSGNYFSALGLKPAVGRFLRPDEVVRPGSEPVVVISYDYWRTRFASAPTVPGRSLRVNGVPLTIVGVAPERFQGTVLSLTFDMWAPATLAPTLFGGSRELEDRSLRGYTALGTLRPGTSVDQAQTELEQAMRELGRVYPETNASMHGEVLSFWRAPRGPQRMLANALLMLQGVLLLLLLAVCGNTANLLLARASTRQREMGVRLALGAGPWRVLTLQLMETLMLGIGGAALGAAIATWATNALRAVPFIGSVPVRFQTDLDPGFTREGVLLAAYDLSDRNQDGAFSRDFARRLLDRLRALPEVEAASIASSVPLDIHGLPMRSFSLEGRVRSDATLDTALTNTVTPDYFRTMGIPLRAGVDFASIGDAT